jgi:hypothetical protein
VKSYFEKKMDISEIEYINILPDMDMDDSSFLKSSFVNGGTTKNENSKIEEDKVQ